MFIETIEDDYGDTYYQITFRFFCGKCDHLGVQRHQFTNSVKRERVRELMIDHVEYSPKPKCPFCHIDLHFEDDLVFQEKMLDNEYEKSLQHNHKMKLYGNRLNLIKEEVIELADDIIFTELFKDLIYEEKT